MRKGVEFLGAYLKLQKQDTAYKTDVLNVLLFYYGRFDENLLRYERIVRFLAKHLYNNVRTATEKNVFSRLRDGIWIFGTAFVII